MSLGMTDPLPFGQYRDKTVAEVAKKNPGYLLWLRDKRAGNGELTFFSQDVLDYLDVRVEQNPRLRADFEKWADKRAKIFAARGAEIKVEVPVAPAPVAQPTPSYAGWGSW